uniref:Peptidase S1 domain-containing protein n=1 Tax=Timema douglasi TaxID=61478 RepID=A0A7R8Z9Z3_TIMDO|nr:unnamed protein product [Timema douglasi]
MDAAPSPDHDISVLEPATRYMPVLEGAPKYPGSRIVNGNQASRGQFPLSGSPLPRWEVLLWRIPHFDHMGAISRPLHFGVCGIGTTTVHLGSQNLNSVEAGKVTVTTRSHVNHASYNTDNLNNDISLLRLPFSVTLGCEYSFTAVSISKTSPAPTTSVYSPFYSQAGLSDKCYGHATERPCSSSLQ